MILITSLSRVIYHACTNINQRTKSEVPSFTDSKDMIGAKIKNKLALYGTVGRLLLTANFKVTGHKN